VGTDTVSLQVDFGGGRSASLTAVRGVPDYFRITAIGTDGWAEVNGFGVLQHQLGTAPRTTETYPSSLQTGTLLGAFARAISGREIFPVSTDAMLTTTSSLAAAIASYGDGGSWVELDRAGELR